MAHHPPRPVTVNHSSTSSGSTSRQVGDIFNLSVTAESGRGLEGSPARGLTGSHKNCLTNQA